MVFPALCNFSLSTIETASIIHLDCVTFHIMSLQRRAKVKFQPRDFPLSSVVKDSILPIQDARVWSLRSHMLQGVTKQKNKTKQQQQNTNWRLKQSLTLLSSPDYEVHLINMNLNKMGTLLLYLLHYQGLPTKYCKGVVRGDHLALHLMEGFRFLTIMYTSYSFFTVLIMPTMSPSMPNLLSF